MHLENTYELSFGASETSEALLGFQRSAKTTNIATLLFNCASFFTYFCYYVYNPLQKNQTGLYSLLSNTRSLVLMIFSLVFCTFTVLLFGCFSRKFVQVAISGFSTFTCASSTSTPPHEPTKVSIDSLWPTCIRYYRIWGPVCFNDELSTDDVENSFLDVFSQIPSIDNIYTSIHHKTQFKITFQY